MSAEFFHAEYVAIESHGVTAYNRTKFLDDRRVMMQEWADYLDKLKAGAEVIPITGRVA